MCVCATRCASISIQIYYYAFCWFLSSNSNMEDKPLSSSIVKRFEFRFFFQRYQFKWWLDMCGVCAMCNKHNIHLTVAWNWRISTAIYLFVLESSCISFVIQHSVSSEKWIGHLFMRNFFLSFFHFLLLDFLVNWNLIFLILVFLVDTFWRNNI